MKNRLDLIIGILIIMIISSCGGKKSNEIAETIRPVKYGEIKLTGGSATETLSGTAQSSKDVNISFKVGGTINGLFVKIGDVVSFGQRIAQIDPTDYNVQYQQALANLASVETQIKSASTQLVNSKAVYQRVEKLYENNSVSLSEFEQAKSTYELAQSSYTAAEAQAEASKRQVESAKNQLSYSNLTAPFAGVITAVHVEANELVGSGTPVATISATQDPEISVGIPEIYISRIKANQPVRINFSSIAGTTFSGRVYEVGFSSLGGSTYPVTVKIDNPTSDIRPGMVADVQFNFDDQDQTLTPKLIVPIAAVGEDSEGHYVFSLQKEGDHYLAQKVTVEIGPMTSTGFEIRSGMDQGGLVATAGLNT
ncbi:MAG: efflux RND transporter periplasmic adaptor subunit, partial [Bacteroidia bacterium]|nr:efflux RND transporter periplasmic adaptor subunit [Bacteroidia bacterium]